jgi:hypothetical protein
VKSWKQKIVEHIRSIPLTESEMNSAILSESLPIISFGDFTTSNYLTLGINPSSNEFTEDRGLARISHLGLDTWASLSDQTLISDSQIYSIYEASCAYFNKGMNPYKWFDFPRITLNALGVSYGQGFEEMTDPNSNYQKRASHIDLTPWTTKKRWSKTDFKIREKLLLHNSEFLMQQLMHDSVEVILILGSDTLSGFKKSMRSMGISCRESEGAPFRITKEAREVMYKKITFSSREAFFVSQGPSAQEALSRNVRRRTSRPPKKTDQSLKEEKQQIFVDFAEYIYQNNRLR